MRAGSTRYGALPIDGEDPGPPGALRRLDLHLVADSPPEHRPAEGESGDTPPTLEISICMRSPCSSSISTCAPTPTTSSRGLGDDDGPVEPVAQHPDPPLEQALLVLRGVVLEVLREIAEAARGRDCLDGLRAARPFQLCEFGLEVLLLRLRELLDLLLGHRSSLPSVVRVRMKGASKPKKLQKKQPQKTLKEKRAEKKKK